MPLSRLASMRRFCARWRAILGLCGVLLVFVVRSLSAQQTQPTSYAGFDGQLVSVVEIAAGPNVDVAVMRRLVKQQAGKPFSADLLRQSVAALQQTHQFSRVQVSVEPEQAGLTLLFILQPTSYIGVLEFPGTGTRFPYTALVQATNIADQSPYFADLLVSGRQGLLDYFHKHGYFEAQVKPQIQRDDQHRIVNVVFECTLGQRAKLRAINFTGISEQEASPMRAALRGIWAKLKRVSLKPGQQYSEAQVDKSISFIRDRLRNEGRLSPSVRLASANFDPASNRVDITFDVAPGPKVFVRIVGAHVSRRKLRRLIPIYEEGSVDQDLVDEGEKNLKAYFQTKGYFHVTADSHIDRQDGIVNVVYEVSRGTKHSESGVYFNGNHYFSDRQLKPRVLIEKGFLFLHGKYSEQLLTKSVASLKQLYKDQGFENVSIQPKLEDFNPDVIVTFNISEGPQDTVATLQVIGNKTQSLSSLTTKHPLHLKPGSKFSQKLMEADRTDLLAAYLDRGYQNADVRAAAVPAPNDAHKMDVTYTVDEGPETNISNVLLLGEKYTKPSFITQVIGRQIKSSQPLSEGHFLQAESDLYDLGIFDWASVEPLRPIVDQTSEEVLVKVHESALNTMDIGGGIEVLPRDANIPVNAVAVPGLPPITVGNKFSVSQKSYFGPRFTFDWTRHDLRGRAETATIGTIVSRLDQRGFFTYADPHLRGTSWSSLLSLSVERTTENPIYTAELGQASFQIDKTLDKKRTTHAIARYTFNRTDLSNILIPGLVLPQDQHVRLSTFDGEYVRDTRDKPLDAHRGIYQTFDFGVTAKALGASASFVRFLGQTAFYKQVTPWLVWANNFRLGLANPFSGSDVPLSERFFTGGPDSLRGFPIDGAGPQRPLPVCTNPANPSTCTLISVPVGGNMLFIVNSEARFPLPFKSGLGGAFFYDGGNVYSNISLRQFTQDFTHSIGVGLRYQTPVGPIRFDVGYRLTSVRGVQATQYFVTLGQSF
jgi:outer membrane protein insertion porin family